MTFSSYRSKDDWDQGVWGPSLQTPHQGPGLKLQKNAMLTISKSEFGLIIVLP